MGAYIDPVGETKEEWLAREGRKFLHLRWQDLEEDELPVVLIQNPQFTAAAIAYCEEEFIIFLHPRDHRPKTIYVVKKDKLLQIAPSLKYYLNEINEGDIA